jgi:hypothetical protein
MLPVRWVDGQAFAPYDQWECFKSGFHSIGFDEHHANQSAELYGNADLLVERSFDVLEQWPITCAVHISQRRNHRAWMGHAACFLSHGAGALSSVAAYWMLDSNGREVANSCVMQAVNHWIRRNEPNSNLESCRVANAQLEFPFWTLRGRG